MLLASARLASVAVLFAGFAGIIWYRCRVASRFRLPGAIFLLVLAIYLAVPTRQYYWDGVGFAIEIERAPQLRPTLANSNHLIYEPLGYYAWRALNAAGIGVGAHALLRYANMALGAATASILCALLLRLLGSAYLAGCLSLLFAFSATWWKFATDANAYIPSVLLLVLAFSMLSREERAQAGTRTALAVGCLHAGAMLVHQLAVFFFPAVLHALWRGHRRPPRERTRLMAAYSAVAAGITLPAYYYGSYLETHRLTPGSFLRWIAYHAPGTSFSLNPLADVAKSAASHLHLFFGGKATEILPAVRSWRVVPVILFLACVFYLVRHMRTTRWKPVWHAIRQLAGAAFSRQPQPLNPSEAAHGEAGAGRSGVHDGSERMSAGGPGDLLHFVAGVAAAWVAVYVVFLFFWLPQNAFYRLFYLPALIVLGGVILRAAREKGVRQYRLASFVAGMALFNFVLFVYPHSRVEANPALHVAERARPYLTPGTVVFFVSLPTDDWPLFYMYRHADWAQLKTPDRAVVERRIQQADAEGRTAWAETTALDLIASAPGGSQWIDAHTRADRKIEVIDRKHRIRLVQLFP